MEWIKEHHVLQNQQLKGNATYRTKRDILNGLYLGLMMIALRAGQIIEGKTIHPTKLFSEDINSAVENP